MSLYPPRRDWLYVKQAPKRAHAQSGPGALPLVMFQRILEAVSREFGTTPKLLKGPRRDRQLVLARFAAVALVLELCPELSLPAIGRLLGQRDHTTIIHARRRAGELLQPDRHSGPWRARYTAAREALLDAQPSRTAN
jgi:chromosomal replication initiator protein